MKIYAYVDGQLKITVNVDVPFESLKNQGREYLGIKGTKELLAVYKQVEEQLKQVFPVNPNAPSLEELNLDETNLNEYLINKFPQLQQLELRAEAEGYSSSVKNLFGKQYGYPLVWLNANKYNHYVLSDEKKHQWERCIYGAKLNSLDKIGSLTKHFQEAEEASFYQGDYNAWLNSVKNSFPDNLLLTSTRQGSNVPHELANMEDFDQDKQFAVYENDDKKQVTYITPDIKSALKDCLDRLDGSKTIKILFPIEVSNGKYDHVIMGSVTLTKPEDIAQCKITIYDALTSDPFAQQEVSELNKIEQQIAEAFAEKEADVAFTSDIYNMKYQLPLQTHCGRFVMTWMAAEVAGLDIKKLSNYNEPFNYLFGQLSKNTLSFDSSYERGEPAAALAEFSQELANFFEQRKVEFSKQWTSAGKEDLDFSKTLLALIDNLASKGDVETKKKLIADLEILAPTITNVKLKNLVDRGMINLGYGSLSSFLTQAQAIGFSFSTRDNIVLQYQKLDEARGDVLTFDDEEDEELLKNKGIEDEDDFEILDIDDQHLASDILPSKQLEAQVKLAQSEHLAHEDELNEEARKKLEQENPNQATIKI